VSKQKRNTQFVGKVPIFLARDQEPRQPLSPQRAKGDPSSSQLQQREVQYPFPGTQALSLEWESAPTKARLWLVWRSHRHQRRSRTWVEIRGLREARMKRTTLRLHLLVMELRGDPERSVGWRPYVGVLSFLRAVRGIRLSINGDSRTILGWSQPLTRCASAMSCLF
jgi:hypothetical protein